MWTACRWALVISAWAVTVSSGKVFTTEKLRAAQAQAVERWQAHPTTDAVKIERLHHTTFYVDGTTIPEVTWDLGPSWSGLLPISGDSNETRKLFFWFFPPGPEGSSDDIIVWLNGGPGGSSLEGLLQENGPFGWAWGQAKPTQNEYSWTNLSSIIWIDQPIGTGFSQGDSEVRDEEDVAEQLVGFLQQFLGVFSELQGKNLYLTGESYAGMYIPYTANYIYDHVDALNLNLTGIWLGSPAITNDVIANEVPAVNFVHKYENVFGFNQSFLSELDSRASSCHYAAYLDKYLTYPPPDGSFALPGSSIEFDEGCDLWSDIVSAALVLNPAFNVYRIFDMYPVLWDVLGFPGTYPAEQTSPVYFNRDDVKQAIHAPVDVDWSEAAGNPFVDSLDNSQPSSFGVLGSVIEKSQRTVIMHGLADFCLLAEGTMIALQNMTWNGLQGFQSAPENDSFILDGVGATGTVQSERGLTFYTVALTGHMAPQFNPKAAYQSMQYLMGFRSTP